MAEPVTVHLPRGDTANPGLCLDVAGSGELVVFLHGIGGNRTNWSEQVALVGDSFRAVAWDARGYNGSEDYDGPLVFSDFAHDLARVLDFFGARKAHLVGLSMGGRIAQEFYALYPARVATLTLVATMSGLATLGEDGKRQFVSARLDPLLKDGKTLRDVGLPAAKRLMGPNAGDALRQRLAAATASAHLGSYIKTVRASADYDRTDNLGNIAVPTLLVFGEHDPLTRPEMGREMHRKIKGSEFVLIADSGHLINLEQPDAFNAALLAFLGKNRGAANAA